MKYLMPLDILSIKLDQQIKHFWGHSCKTLGGLVVNLTPFGLLMTILMLAFCVLEIG